MNKNTTKIQYEPYVEMAEPKRSLLKSDFLFYLFVLFTAILLIFSVSFVFFMANVENVWPQAVIFVLLLLYGWWIYKKQLIQYRYTVGTSLLTVERIVGKKNRKEIAVHLSDIRLVDRYNRDSIKPIKHRDSFFCGKKHESTVVVYRVGKEDRIALISLTDNGIKELKERIRSSRN